MTRRDDPLRAPTLENSFVADAALRGWLRHRVPDEVRAAIEPNLERLGERAVTDVLAMAADAVANPARLVRHDPWGERVDRIETADGWGALDAVAAEEGIVAAAYERAHGPWSRVDQLVRLYLFHPSSAIYSCPLAMTDGAARVLELHADEELRARALPRLVSTDPARFWTSGQWMTERTGGSDVSGTSTVAVPIEGPGSAEGPDEPSAGFWTHRLRGEKWFCSATTAPVALALARLEEGITLFYLETRGPDGGWNGIRVRRLKEKLGTRAMPTAELVLDGVPARILGPPGAGVRTVATMLNVTRLYNAVCSAAQMQRAIALASDWARRRRAFGARLLDQPLHREVLKQMRVEHRAALHLVLHLATLLGREETARASAEERTLLRALTPLAKLFTAKQAVAVTSEAIECFGGAGYLEDTGLPRLLRDAQVLPIWEGTTSVLALDLLRALEREEALSVVFADLRARLAGVEAGPLASAVGRTAAALDRLERGFVSELEREPEAGRPHARALAFGLGRASSAALLLEHAELAMESGEAGRELPPDVPDDVEAALRWCEFASPLFMARTPEREER